MRFQNAKLVILNGAEFEKWPTFVSLPLSKTIESVNLPPEELVKYEDSISHRHGLSGEHSHEGIDGHTWLDPVMAKLQSKTILDAMKKFGQFIVRRLKKIIRRYRLIWIS